jgi:YHS domain-containing protein
METPFREENPVVNLAIVVMTLAAVAPAPASAKKPVRKATAATVPATAPAVERVADPSLVCMVNDMDMGKKQIPVVVEGRTYYGCCAMCKDRLARDAGARTAIDPVSAKTVDKSEAVIARRPDGSVVYFESEANLKKYAARR